MLAPTHVRKLPIDLLTECKYLNHFSFIGLLEHADKSDADSKNVKHESFERQHVPTTTEHSSTSETSTATKADLFILIYLYASLSNIICYFLL